MKLTNGELANLRDVAFAEKDYSLMVQVESELNHRSDLSVINHRVLKAERTHLYQCPVCRRYSVCYSASIRALCQQRGFCTDCRDSEFIQLRYRIALLDQALRTDVKDWNDTEQPGPVPLKVRALRQPALRTALLALYDRCQAKRAVFQKQLQEATDGCT